MIDMLSSFDPKPDENLDTFGRTHCTLLTDLRATEVIVNTSDIAKLDVTYAHIDANLRKDWN
jgi:hypothetical protein